MSTQATMQGPPISQGEPATRHATKPRRVREHRPLWLMLPGIAFILLIIVIPFLFGLWISFLQLDQYSLRQWVHAPFLGLANYIEAVTRSSLPHSLWTSVSFAVLTTAVITPLGFLGALTVNGRFRGRAVIRSIYLVPYVIPGFVTGMMWRVLLQPSGPVNQVLQKLGLGGAHQFLIGTNSFWTMVVVSVWSSWAFIYLMTLAGLQTIPGDLYEAADIDGSTWWQKIRHVVVPQVRGPLSLGLLLSMLHAFNNFTLPFILFGTPAPQPATTLPVDIYQTSFQVFRFGLGAAMSIIALLIFMVPAVLYLRSIRLDARAEEVAG